MGYVKSIRGRRISEVGLTKPDPGQRKSMSYFERAVDLPSKPVLVNELLPKRSTLTHKTKRNLKFLRFVQICFLIITDQGGRKCLLQI